MTALNDSAPSPARIIAESVVILLVPLFVFKCLSFLSIKDFQFTRLYLSTMVAVTTALLALASLVRLQLSRRQALGGLAGCMAAILLVTMRAHAAQAPPHLLPQMAQFLIVFVVDVSLVLGGGCLGRFCAGGVKRSSYLVMAALATSIGDTYSVFFGPTGKLIEQSADLIAPRAMLQWFVIGNDTVVPLIGVGDLLFLALFLWGVRRFDFDLPRNVIMQLLVLGLAYALIIGESLTGSDLKLAGLMFIGPAFLAANWGRFDIDQSDRRSIACLLAGLLIAIVSLMVIQAQFGWLTPHRG